MISDRPKFVGDAIYTDADGVEIGHYGPYRLYSAYQPIWHYTEADGFSPFGYEGLIRPTEQGVPVSPDTFFGLVPKQDKLFIECMCYALHVRNYHHCRPADGKLFFNVNPENYTSIDDFDMNFKFMLNKLDDLEVNRKNIVLEVVETNQAADGVLVHIRNFARREKIKLAIDDFGQKFSTLERYLTFMPDIVKVDRDVFMHACESFVACRMLHTLIQQFHDQGTTVLVEGIETHQQFEIAVILGADLYQGFMLGRPTILPTAFAEPQHHTVPLEKTA